MFNICIGPIASLESIKHLGTNGGGFLAGNSATPFENPNIWSNFIEMGSIILFLCQCCSYLVACSGHW
ncbi:potassium-transporting ATPase subunit KdpA [Staphylococcus aureus]